MKIAGQMRAVITGMALVAIVFAGSTIPAAQARPPSNSGVWLIFIDDLHVDFPSTGRLRLLVGTIVASLLAEGDYSAMLSSGPSSIALDLSPDRKRLLALTQKATGSAMATPTIVRILRREARSNELHYRAVVSLTTAEDAVAKFEQMSSAVRAVVYISDGYGVEPLADSGQAPPSAGGAATKPHVQVTADDVRRHLAELIAIARRAGVTIFPVDARRLRVSTGDPIEDTPEALRYRANARASLRVIAEGTGGLAILEENALDIGLANINRAMRR